MCEMFSIPAVGEKCPEGTVALREVRMAAGFWVTESAPAEGLQGHLWDLWWCALSPLSVGVSARLLPSALSGRCPCPLGAIEGDTEWTCMCRREQGGLAAGSPVGRRSLC